MLTRDDIELLMLSLDALKDKQGMADVFESMLGVMLSRSQEEAESNLKQIEGKRLSKKGERVVIEEQIILLKAKLIQMRDKIDITDFVSGIEK